MILFIFLIILSLNVHNGLGLKTLYNTSIDNVENLVKSDILKIYNSDRASFVEFYNHWCKACKNKFSSNYLQFLSS